jgi:ParB-like chromosome segregation protein Spo0J
MNASVANVISVDFRTAPVVTDFAEASTPRSELARRLAAEALAQTGKLGQGGNKAGKLRTLSEGRSDVFALNPYLIKVRPGFNNRIMNSPDNLAHIDSLAISIAEVGVKKPLVVAIEGDEVFLVDGECRLLGTLRAIEVYGAEIATIPAMTDGRFADEASRVADQIVLNGGKAFTPLEQGKVFVKLISFGWSHARIAKTAGLTPVRVGQILDLMADSNEGIRDMVAAGQISSTAAAQILKASDGDAVVAENVMTAAVTVAKAAGKTRATAKHVKAASGAPAKMTTKAELAALFLAKTTLIEVLDKRTVTVRMSAANWNRVSTLLNID